MPELPEVQTVVDDLNAAGLAGATVTRVSVNWPKTVAGHTPEVFAAQLTGRRIASIRRRAKYIIFDLKPSGHLIVHLRMTGRFDLTHPRTRHNKHEHVLIGLGRQRQLRYIDPRKFGRFYLVRHPEEILASLGPEPLAPNFGARDLAARLGTRKRCLKPLLLDQTFIAGLGNIYVDEALWEAGLHPERRAHTLTEEQIRRLHRAIRKVLRRGLRNLGTTLGTGETTFYSIARNKGRNRDALQVFRRDGRPCPRCRQTISRIIVGQRSTHICRHCQT